MIRRLFLISAITALLVACGTGAPSRSDRPLTDEEIIAQRAKARWDAIIAKDYAAAYEYLTPGTRATTPLNAYILRMSGATLRWTDAKVGNVVCEEPDVCVATVTISYTVRQTRPGLGDLGADTPLKENWLRSGGQWYHLPEKTGR